MPKGLIKPDVLATEEVLGEALESRCGHSKPFLEDACPAPPRWYHSVSRVGIVLHICAVL